MPYDHADAQGGGGVPSRHYGLVVELNEDGKIIRSLHDPNGTLYTAVSEVAEDAGRLYIGSFNKNFVGVLSSKSLLPPVAPDPSHGESAVCLCGWRTLTSTAGTMNE